MQSLLNQTVYHQFYDSLSAGVCVIRADSREEILFVNRRVPELYGCKSEDEFYRMTGGTFCGMTKPSDGRPLRTHVAKGKPYSYWYYDIPAGNGSASSAEMIIAPDKRDGIPVYICQIFTEEMKTEGFKSDGLTGLPGVYDFTEHIFTLLRSCRDEKKLDQWAVVYFNIVNFKSYNNANGIIGGDRVIKKTAEILQDVFGGCYLGHLSADNFAALVPRDFAGSGIREAIQSVNDIIRNKSVLFKAGVFFPDNDNDDKTLRSAVDFARIACDSISEDATKTEAVYNSRMQASAEKKSYILNHFDSALENGYIRVYYQPVVRTMTQKLCSFEALARWEDPEMGMITPADFIPLLEHYRLIGRLDAYVVKNVCRFLKERRDNGYDILPVSVNFSRLDFELINPIGLLKETLDQYGLPHSCIHVEITETIMAWDRDRLIKIIRDFHEAGFEVWLDDFGSDYSSLKSLHYYPFDVLKIDLEFFRNFNERGRKIITSVVMMAKSLGMYTLAEGVETEQQLEFLRTINCGRIQGWYYAKPMPFDAVMEQMSRRGISEETSLESGIFQKVGLVNTVTDRPTAIFRYDGRAPELLSANDAYMDVLRSTGTTDFDTANKNLRSGLFAVQKKICTFLNKVACGTARSMTYIDNGQYIYVEAEKIAGTEELWYGKAFITNISADENVRQYSQTDGIFRNMALIFDGIYYFNLREDKINIIESSHRELSPGSSIHGVDQSLGKFAENHIYPGDRQRFVKFTEKNHLYEMAEKSGRSEATDLFRVHWDDGSYHWSVFHAIVLLKSVSRDVILLEREDVWEREENRQLLLPEFVSSFPDMRAIQTAGQTPAEGGDAARFHALLQSRDFMFFWTDREGRVKGMSEAFAKYSGFSLTSVIGKTGRSVHFFMNVPELVRYEKQLLDSGTEVQTETAVMHDGVVEDVTLTGIPYYEGKMIAGALIFLTKKIQSTDQKSFLDERSGFLDYPGILAAAGRYDDAYRDSGSGYCVMEIAPQDMNENLKQYGDKASDIIIRVMSEALHGADLSGVAVGRTEGCTFLLIAEAEIAEKLSAIFEICRNAVENRAKNDNVPLIPRIDNGIAFGTETTDSFGALQLAHDRRVSGEKNAALSFDPMKQFIMDLSVFDESPEWATLIDPATHRVLYANHAVRSDFHIAADEDISGMKCYELFNGTDQPCKYCNNGRLRREAVYCWNRRYQYNGKLMLNRDFLIPYRGQMAVMSVGIPISTYMNLNSTDHELLQQEANVNDTIERGLSKNTPEESIQEILQGIAQDLGSDRILIFEHHEGSDSVLCTYEWHQPGLVPVMQDMQSIPTRDLRPLYHQFDDRQVVLIGDYEAFTAEHSDMKLPISGIRNIISGRMQLSGNIYGFTMVINSSGETFRQASLLLWTLTDVLAVLMRTRNLQKQISRKEFVDPLTGVWNRQGLRRYVDGLKGQCRVVFILGKVEGLKEANMSGGQTAGDRILKKAADILTGLTSENRVFRIGGGEFVIVEEQIDESGAELFIRRIREENRPQNIQMSFGLAAIDGKAPDFDEIMRQMEVSLSKNSRRSMDFPDA